MMDHARDLDAGRLALAIGVVAAGSAVCLATYFVVRGPFGTINDFGNATTGVLSAALAWRLRRRISGRAGDVAVSAASVGAAFTVIGTALVVSDTSGFLLGGLVSTVGFAGIGAWLLVVNRREAAAAWSPRLRALGVAAGALMAVGVLTAPGIILRLDDLETAPAWIWIGFFGWLGTYVAYPAWALWMGIAETRLATPTRSAPAGTAVE
jgi:hypothetical protein